MADSNCQSTNCISEIVRLKPEPRVMDWMEAIYEAMLLYLSVLTSGEIRKGLAGLPQSKRRTRLESWLEVELRARFSGRILLIDGAVAHRWGLLAADAKREGRAYLRLTACWRQPRFATILQSFRARSATSRARKCRL
jgi:predicted nucleic acid-binding protein